MTNQAHFKTPNSGHHVMATAFQAQAAVLQMPAGLEMSTAIGTSYNKLVQPSSSCWFLGHHAPRTAYDKQTTCNPVTRM
jgi:hypothetical protein